MISFGYPNRYFSKKIIIKGRKTCFNGPTLITAQPRIFERLQVVLEFMEKEACLGVVAECGGPFRSAKQPIQNLESNICWKERWLPSGAAAWLRRPRQLSRMTQHRKL